MAEIKRISDEITIMRDGTWVATEKADDLEMDDIIRLMVGRELTNQFPPKTNKPGDVALEVEHLSGMYSILFPSKQEKEKFLELPDLTEVGVQKLWRQFLELQPGNQER